MRDKVSQATLALAKAYTDEHGGGGGGGTDNYNDLTHKPTLNGVEIKGTLTGASLGLVNAEDGKSLSTNDYSNTDKAIVGGVTDALAGKQDTISDLATIRSGASAGASAYQKPATGIPKTDLASAVQTSLEKADSAVQDVSGKADKVTNATNGNFAGLGANGNLTDSGSKASDFMPSNTPIPSIANCYQSTDTAESALADDDYFPFYNTSASEKRKTLWSTIKSVLKTYFDTVYATVSSLASKAEISSIGTNETGTTASKDYVAGEFFYKNGKLGEVLTSISKGAIFTLNTNYKETDVAEVIKNISTLQNDLFTVKMIGTTESLFKYINSVTLSGLRTIYRYDWTTVTSFDGKYLLGWESPYAAFVDGTNTGIITINFNQKISLNNVFINTWGRADSIIISGSNDGNTYTTLFNGSDGGSSLFTAKLNPTGYYSYYKITMAGQNKGPAMYAILLY